MRRDSPVQWTGEAHLVTTSCTECGDSVEVAEGKAERAAQGLRPITCEDCEHDCRRHLVEAPQDPLLPDHIVPYTCEVCGEAWHFDVETGQHEVAE